MSPGPLAVLWSEKTLHGALFCEEANMDAPRDIRTPKCNQTFCTKFSQLCIRIKSRGGKTRTYCVARGTLLNVMWQPGGERGLGENGYMPVYGWVPLLITCNYHSIVHLLCVCAKVLQLCLCATPWIGVHQAALSMRFSRQEYWSGLPYPSPGDLLDPGIKAESLRTLALTNRFFTTSATWEAPKSGCGKCKHAQSC